MKKKIILGLALCSLVLTLGGIYIIAIIHSATVKLDNLIMLHQVEILREHYLIQIRRVQSDLTLQGTPHSQDFDTVVGHVLNMGRVVDTCFDCHHKPEVAARLEDLKARTEAYKNALSRVMTMRAGTGRLGREADEAFRIGEDLIDRVSDMIAMTGIRLEASTQKTLKDIQDTKYVLYLIVGVGPLISAVLGFIFVRGLTRPVQVLVESTRRIKSGDLDHRVVGLRNEFGELGTAFNDMAASLKEQIAKMQRAEQMAVAGELAAGLAHEIKNPLAGIKVAMQVLSAEEQLAGEDRDVVDRVSQEITRLEGLMKAFLNFARPPKPQPVEIDLNNLVKSTLALHGRTQRLATGRPDGIRLVTELGTLPPARVDPMQLQQVVLNLFINAIDAMPEGGSLTVRTAYEQASRTIAIVVADTGKGIDPEHAERIFQPFFTTKLKGTGLGLSVSRQLVERHGGSLTVGPTPGGGATFTIRLPLDAGGAGGVP